MHSGSGVLRAICLIPLGAESKARASWDNPYDAPQDTVRVPWAPQVHGTDVNPDIASQHHRGCRAAAVVDFVNH